MEKLINPSLTQEQVDDIKKREKEVYDYLKEKGFIVDAVVQKVNVGEGMFVDKVIPYLQDTDFSRKVPVTTPADESTKKI